ncbi:MAG: hypothetical protein WCC53_16340 [Thermoanaerobaculia bacterium]
MHEPDHVKELMQGRKRRPQVPLGLRPLPEAAGVAFETLDLLEQRLRLGVLPRLPRRDERP